MNATTLRSLFTRASDIAIKAHPELAHGIKEFQFRDLRVKAGTDKEEIDGISAAQGLCTPFLLHKNPNSIGWRSNNSATPNISAER